MTQAYSTRKNSSGVEYQYGFLKKTLEIYRFATDSFIYAQLKIAIIQKFGRKQAFNPGNSAKFCDIPWKFQAYKPSKTHMHVHRNSKNKTSEWACQKPQETATRFS